MVAVSQVVHKLHCTVEGDIGEAIRHIDIWNVEGASRV